MDEQNLKEDLEFLFADPNPRRVLESFSKEVKEEPINMGPYQEGQIEASPVMLALSVIIAAQNHLNLILKPSKISLPFVISKQIKTDLFLDLLALHYFLFGENIKKYLTGKQFTLFVLRVHVAILDNLPSRDTLWLFGIFGRKNKIKEIEEKLSAIIRIGERFYIKSKLTNEEKEKIDELKKFLLANNPKTMADYEKNLILQFLVKGFYRICKILNLTLPKDLKKIMMLYISYSEGILSTQEHVARYIKPVWHDKK